MRIQEYFTIFSCITQAQEENIYELENQKDKPTCEGLEQYFAVEVIEQSKRNAKHWFIAFLVTLAALIGTNAAWLYTAGTYDYVSQDGTGLNNINTGTQGDLENGTESQN